MKGDQGTGDSSQWIAGDNCQQPVPGLRFFAITALGPISQSELLQEKNVSRIQIQRLLEIARRLVPTSFTPVHESAVLKNLRLVRQSIARGQQLPARFPEIAQSIIIICRQSEMGFAGLRP